MLRHCLLVSVLLLLLSTAACSAALDNVQAQTGSSAHPIAIFSAKSETVSYTLGARAPLNNARLILRATVKSGGLSWTLQDPAGKAVWQGTLRPGESVDETFAAPPQAGNWTLIITMNNATGSYDADWRAWLKS